MFRILGLIVKTALYNFRQWRGNIRVLSAFLLAFILCFLLTDKTVDFAAEQATTLQIVEGFVLSFGDSNSILLSSLLLILIFADMPFITAATPFFLARSSRKIWVFGQLLYIVMAAFVYLLFILMSTCFLTMTMSYTKNSWSQTVAILAYSDEGSMLALPAAVKTLEMSRPYQTMAWIFLLMLLYILVMVFIMMFFNIWKGSMAGMVSVLIFSVYGLLLNPENIQNILQLPKVFYYKARVWVGWLSVLNHATFSMHDFGYDRLPTLLQSVGIFLCFLGILAALTVCAMKKYSFQFKGTER